MSRTDEMLLGSDEPPQWPSDEECADDGCGEPPDRPTS